MPRGSLSALLFLCGMAALAILGCTPPEEPVRVSAVHWLPGTTHRFGVQEFKSGFVGDSSFSTPGRSFHVTLTVLDTVAGARIEWQEFMKDDETGAYSHPLTRIVYHTDINGRFDRILNYPELKAYVDTMTSIYLGQVGVDSATGASLKAVVLDSAMLVHTATKHIRLVHYLYGASFPTASGSGTGQYSSAYGRDTAQAQWPDAGLFDPLPMHCRLGANGLCDADDGLVNMEAWEDPRELDATATMRSYLGPALSPANVEANAIVDTMGTATVVDTVNMCYWQAEGFPVHIQHIQHVRLALGTFTEEVFIDLVEE